ncbi:MAG: hypothetical protein IPK29_04130 [Betaproteobacteria bacterium]|nr:hypothetical protein [Betaproteobacteria bacterium]
MKFAFLAGALLATFCTTAPAAGNPGKSAMECVSAARDKNDVVFTNNCGSKVFVVWCGEMKYTKKRCGDGPSGNNFYTHSNNIEPGKSVRASAIQEYRYAACHGGIAFGKDEIKDNPDGSFRCVPTGDFAKKAQAESTEPVPAPVAAASRPAATTAVAPASPLGNWQVVTDTGQRLKLSLSSGGAVYDDGEDKYPGRWSQRGNRITVLIYPDEGFMRRNESPVTMELELDQNGMRGTQLAYRTRVASTRALKLTLTRLN